MKYRFLGRSGLKVSEFCLGAMTFGREASKGDSFRMLDYFAEAGGNFIDTANVYSRGISESIVGEWLGNQDRSQYVIASKVRWSMGEGPNEEGLSRKHIFDAIDATLRRLDTDYLDLYQVHGWDDVTPLEETLSALDQLVRDGKVRYLGASNYSGWQLQKAIDLSRYNGWAGFISLQPLYNLIDRETEWELIPLCQSAGLGMITWSPLRGGWLSGKYTRDMSAPPAGTRLKIATEQGWSETWDKYANERTWSIIDVVRDIAKETGKTPAQVSLRWLLQRPGVTAPIVGASKLSHLTDNLGAADFTLNEEQMLRLNDISEKELPYPYHFMRSRKE
ncbi:MAG: aldo/keto reductase [Anaerolineaceae bacterium]|nr:aldo/keto reductase [Anaerolineaceae bacterium]